MRLIDADATLEQMKGMNMLFSPKIVIDNMPTVYDIDKVIEELESIECASGAYERKCWLDKAIKIVKRGGKE